MGSTLGPYITCVGNTLRAVLCLRSFPCQEVDRQSKPEVEYQSQPELLLKPLLICRNQAECCLIEGSVNSVRVSFKIKQVDQLDKVIVTMFLRFLTQRAEKFGIIRRVPVEGYDISFLITNTHLEVMARDKVVDFLCEFMEDIDSEVSDLKLSVNTRARAVASEVLSSMES